MPLNIGRNPEPDGPVPSNTLSAGNAMMQYAAAKSRAKADAQRAALASMFFPGSDHVLSVPSPDLNHFQAEWAREQFMRAAKSAMREVQEEDESNRVDECVDQMTAWTVFCQRIGGLALIRRMYEWVNWRWLSP